MFEQLDSLFGEKNATTGPTLAAMAAVNPTARSPHAAATETSTTQPKTATTATRFRATVARPSASKKCQSSGLPLFTSLNSAASGRVAFAIAFFGLELAGIAWGQRTPDHVLGFQMFNESSRLTIHLFREVERRGHRVLVPVVGGHWQAPDASGQLRDYAWGDRVGAQAIPLNVLERSMHASYGLAAQLFRLQAALDDVVRHLATDAQTRALVAKVETLQNGRPGELELRADKP